MFFLLLQHGHHFGGPATVLASMAMIGLRLFIRRARAGRGSRGGRPSGRW